MAINYPRMRAMVVRKITENGRPVIIRERQDSAHDPVEGTVDTTYVDVNAQAVFVSITKSNQPELEVLAGDKICFVTQAVMMSDMIVDSDLDEEWQVIDIDEIFPGPLKLVWKCVVRK